ncbi:hypothetical protein LS72_003775 [Helicobacter apodemus]|uniref:Motility protein n=1 Tax=Helicobacter apodemus TaxID=135569 RepID=A0A099U5Q1_9HELI|nr:hypothetical protein [Helicobacter apodemus]AWI34572.1 hypothetical protein CDV25_07190 [Helicobacter apodemus]TLE16200.1 hypothetical protein LS72_003775 [Helicobacter apodemus]
MISGINSASVVASGNLSALKKAINTEENLMGSLINSMEEQSNLQTQGNDSPYHVVPASLPQNNSNGKLDIMA